MDSTLDQVETDRRNIFLPMNPATFNHVPAVEWMATNYQLSFGVVLAYLALVQIGKRVMASRPPFSLRWTLFGWNCLLSLFSITGTSYTLVEMIQLLWYKGFYYSICDVW